MSFSGLRVLALESRRATEIAQLIRNNGGDPVVVPALREVPIDDNQEAFAFAKRLFAGEFDMMIFLTGVGARALETIIASKYPDGPTLRQELRKLAVVARGPKPMAVLREWEVPVAASAAEPNTWREILVAIEGRKERRIAVQEYGRASTELYTALEQKGATVTPVRVYQWAMPEDPDQLRFTVRRIIAGEFDVLVITTGVQITHLMQIATQDGVESQLRAALARIVVASIGPSSTEALEEHGITPDMMPTHPKMGFLIKEAAEQAPGILERKSVHDYHPTKRIT